MFFKSHRRKTKVAKGGTFHIDGLAEFLDFVSTFDWQGVKEVEFLLDIYCDISFSPWFESHVTTKPLATRKAWKKAFWHGFWTDWCLRHISSSISTKYRSYGINQYYIVFTMDNEEKNEILIERTSSSFAEATARVMRKRPLGVPEDDLKSICGDVSSFPYPWQAQALNTALRELE